MKLILQCNQEQYEYESDEEELIELMKKTEPTLNNDNGTYLVDSDTLFSLYLRLSGDIAKHCPLDIEVILFYEWLDEALLDCDMSEKPELYLSEVKL